MHARGAIRNLGGLQHITGIEEYCLTGCSGHGDHGERVGDRLGAAINHGARGNVALDVDGVDGAEDVGDVGRDCRGVVSEVVGA